MNNTIKNNEPVDFVIPWVNGGDHGWLEKRKRYCSFKEEDSGEARYRDWGLMRYWFRGIERFAPWVRTIYFITDGQLPAWLNTRHPKLKVVNHSEFLPERYLPTFNVNVIELNLHRLPGLSEHFVYFNDDIFLLRPVRKEFFFRNGKPCDMLAFQPVVANQANPVMSHIFLNNSLVLAKYFRKRPNMRKQPGSYFHVGYPLLYFGYNFLETFFPLFTGFYTVHTAAPMCRSTYELLWEKEGELLEEVCGHRFRSSQDVNQYLLREWQKLNGEFCPRNITAGFRYFNMNEKNTALVRTIRGRTKRIICVNDASGLRETERIRLQLQEAFRSVLPDRSQFETADPGSAGDLEY